MRDHRIACGAIRLDQENMLHGFNRLVLVELAESVSNSCVDGESTSATMQHVACLVGLVVQFAAFHAGVGATATCAFVRPHRRVALVNPRHGPPAQLVPEFAKEVENDLIVPAAGAGHHLYIRASRDRIAIDKLVHFSSMRLLPGVEFLRRHPPAWLVEHAHLRLEL